MNSVAGVQPTLPITVVTSTVSTTSTSIVEIIPQATTTPIVKKVVKNTAIGVPYTPGIAHQLSNYYADKYGVSKSLMWAITSCENREHLARLQSQNYYTRDHLSWGVTEGEREQSYGLAMIHLPTNTATYSQAIDPDYALNFLAKMLSRGRGDMWTCYGLVAHN